MATGYDYSDQDRDKMRDELIKHFTEVNGIEVHSTIDPMTDAAPGNTLDVWYRTPSGFRVVLSVSIWNPDSDQFDEDEDTAE